jgi:hypothetical protein
MITRAIHSRWWVSVAAGLLSIVSASGAHANPLPVPEDTAEAQWLASARATSCPGPAAASVGMALSYLTDKNNPHTVQKWIIQKGALSCPPVDEELASVADQYCKEAGLAVPYCAVALDASALSAWDDGLAQIRANRPFVAHTNFDFAAGVSYLGAYVLVVGMTDEAGTRYVHFNDPLTGVRLKRTWADFTAHWGKAGYRGVRFVINKPVSQDPITNELILQAAVYHGGSVTDVDGDGTADLCARGSDGVQCLSTRIKPFDTVIVGPDLTDAAGWNDPSRYSTIRMGDLNGDGRADLCARAAAGMRCWLSTGTGFGPTLVGPELSDAAGWNEPKYFTTIDLADVNGDGRDDLCARGPSGFSCWLSSEAGFLPNAVKLPDMADKSGWGVASHYGTLRMGDLNADGKQDVCGRTVEGMACWLSDGHGFSTRIRGPQWSDATGWGDGHDEYWSTIRLADVNGDGRDDLCARTPTGIVCYPSGGTSFGKPIQGPALSDDQGWNQRRYFSTIRLADIDGDGKADLCARGKTGMNCYIATGTGFADAMGAPSLSDDSGWDFPEYFTTIALADVDGDGRADVCARERLGFRCWPAAGSPADLFWVPEFSDAAGWGAPSYFSTLRISGIRASQVVRPVNRGSVMRQGDSCPPIALSDVGRNDERGATCSASTSRSRNAWLLVAMISIGIAARVRRTFARRDPPRF